MSINKSKCLNMFELPTITRSSKSGKIPYLKFFLIIFLVTPFEETWKRSTIHGNQIKRWSYYPQCPGCLMVFNKQGLDGHFKLHQDCIKVSFFWGTWLDLPSTAASTKTTPAASITTVASTTTTQPTPFFQWDEKYPKLIQRVVATNILRTTQVTIWLFICQLENNYHT